MTQDHHKNKYTNEHKKNKKEQSRQLMKVPASGASRGGTYEESKSIEGKDREVRIAEKERAWAMKDAADALIKWDDRMVEHLKKFDTRLTEFQDEVFMMRKFPDEISKKIAAITPDVASGVFNILQQNLTDTFDKNVDVCNNRLKELGKSIDIVATKIQPLQVHGVKKKIAIIGLIVLMSALSAVASSYYMMQQFPQHITIRSTGAISITESTVSIWDSNGIKVKK
jgi:hypothetical protein